MGDFGRLLTAAEVGQRLGYSERYVWKLGREGVLPRVKVAGRKYVRFSEADVERFVELGRQTTARGRQRSSPPLPRRY
ncbi:MAG: helix-turn-helix domain-containing protein [Thermoleophilaceae bacterium]